MLKDRVNEHTPINLSFNVSEIVTVVGCRTIDIKYFFHVVKGGKKKNKRKEQNHDQLLVLRKEISFFFLATGTSRRETLLVPLEVRLIFQHCFVDPTESINYTAWTGVRPFTSESKREEWRSTDLFVRVNKKPNYYYGSGSGTK
jgi:hypothetical protein